MVRRPDPQHQALGNPEEFLNQDINVDVVRRFGARTEADYLNALETVTASATASSAWRSSGGTSNCREIDLLGYYGDAHFAYLRRKDILAQAISLLVATEPAFP